MNIETVSFNERDNVTVDLDDIIKEVEKIDGLMTIKSTVNAVPSLINTSFNCN